MNETNGIIIKLAQLFQTEYNKTVPGNKIKNSIPERSIVTTTITIIIKYQIEEIKEFPERKVDIEGKTKFRLVSNNKGIKKSKKQENEKKEFLRKDFCHQVKAGNFFSNRELNLSFKLVIKNMIRDTF